jgi:WD40 repeat protein
MTIGAGALAFAPDGRSLAIAAAGQPVSLVETATGQVRAELGGAPSEPGTLVRQTAAVAFAPDGRTLYSIGPDATLAAWDLTTGKERQFGTASATGPAPHLAAAGGRLAVRGSDNGVRVYEAATGRLVSRVGDRTTLSPLIAFALAPDGATLATLGGLDGLRLWDAATGRERGPDAGHAGPVTLLAFAPDGRTLTSASAERVCVWDVPARRQRAALEEPTLSARLRALSHDGKRLAFAGATASVRVVEVPGGRLVRQLDSIQTGPYGLAFTPDGGVLAVSEGRSVKLWNLADGAATLTIEAVGMAVTHLAVAPGGRRLAGANGYGGVQVWDAATGRRLWEFSRPGVASTRTPLAFSPDGKRLAYNGGDGQLYVFDAATGDTVVVLDGQANIAPAVAFSPDGRLVASGGSERLVRVWEVATGRLLHTFPGHQTGVESLAFSPDGAILASGAADATILLWNAAKLRPGPADADAAEPVLTAEQVNKSWDDLADADARKTFRAMQALAAAPRSSVPRLKELLRPVDAAEAQKIGPLLNDLDSNKYDVREKATRKLAALGEDAREALQKFLAGPLSPEARARAQGVLNGLGQAGPSPERLRQGRALEVVERIGTAEARGLLEELAKGLPDAHLTREAKAALERLRKNEGEKKE